MFQKKRVPEICAASSTSYFFSEATPELLGSSGVEVGFGKLKVCDPSCSLALGLVMTLVIIVIPCNSVVFRMP